MSEGLKATGPSLECGSGLTTILMGIIARARGYTHWALEHNPGWGARVRQHLEKHSPDSVVLSVGDLHDYGPFSWYRPPLESLPSRFDLVICDGPPAKTKGGRYGLFPLLRDRFARRCVILLDDAGREDEQRIARTWSAETGASLEFIGRSKPFVRLVTPG